MEAVDKVSVSISRVLPGRLARGGSGTEKRGTGGHGWITAADGASKAPLQQGVHTQTRVVRIREESRGEKWL